MFIKKDELIVETHRKVTNMGFYNPIQLHTLEKFVYSPRDT